MSQEPPASFKAPNEDLKDMDVLCIFKIKRERVKIWNMHVSKFSDHIQTKIKIPNLSQEPPASSKVTNHELRDMDVLCIFKSRGRES